MRKRILSIAAAAVMIFGYAAVPERMPFPESVVITAEAIDTFIEKGFKYTVDRDEAHIYWYTGHEKNLKIPEKLGEKTVVEIDGFSDDKELESVVIPKTVKRIKTTAFAGCKKLESVTFSEGLEQLDLYAFLDTGLKKVHIPASVTVINASFAYCPSLKKITVDKNSKSFMAKDGVLYSKDGKTLECYPIGRGDTDVTISEGVEVIDDYAFYKFAGLKSITFPESLREIKIHSFNNCTGLTELTLPSGISRLSYCAFAWCTSLKKAVLPDSLSYINPTAFEKCDKLTVYGVSGTVAQDFAREADIPFKKIGADSFKPAAVTGTAAAMSPDGSAELSWKNSPAANGYEIYMSDKENGNYKKIKTIKKAETGAVIKKLDAGKTYWFKIRAYKKVNGKTVYGSFSGSFSTAPDDQLLLGRKAPLLKSFMEMQEKKPLYFSYRTKVWTPDGDVPIELIYAVSKNGDFYLKQQSGGDVLLDVLSGNVFCVVDTAYFRAWSEIFGGSDEGYFEEISDYTAKDKRKAAKLCAVINFELDPQTCKFKSGTAKYKGREYSYEKTTVSGGSSITVYADTKTKNIKYIVVKDGDRTQEYEITALNQNPDKKLFSVPTEYKLADAKYTIFGGN